MSSEPSDLFEKHVTGLFKACHSLLQTRGDREGRSRLRNCNRRFNKNKSDFIAQFRAIFSDNNLDILAGRTADDWLTEETIYLPYGKKDVKVSNKFNLSKVYNFTSRDSDQQLALQYHLYIIFREVIVDEADKKTLSDICDQLEVALGLDDLVSSESSDDSEDTTTDVLGGVSLEDIGSRAGDIVGQIMGSLGDMGLDMPPGTNLPPSDEIQKVIHSVTSNPNSKEVIRRIVSNVQSGSSIEGVIDDPKVKGLLKDTLSETAKMASKSPLAQKISTEAPELVPADTEGPSDFDPESQT